MSQRRRLWTWVALAVTAALYGVLSVTGLRWGLPSDADDALLFPGRPAWSGQMLAELAPGGARTDAAVGADVDVNPRDAAASPVNLAATPQDAAEIYRRYRLFTRQPDEMITMMALSGMNPRAGQLDPKLYQYGGLFIYPVGGLIGVCGAAGVFPVRSDLTYYLDHPGAFANFYVVARLYAAAWGVLGVLLMYGIARRLGGTSAGLVAALLFALLPVVTGMAHEAKPHLPGAVLMLLAVWLGQRVLERSAEDPLPDGARSVWGWRRGWVALAACCGAAVGMVLSSAPIVVLIPLVAGLELRQYARARAGAVRAKRWVGAFVGRCAVGGIIALAAYLATNPYIAINLFANPAVLRSNFGNSLAMYAVDRVLEGFVRVVQLTAEGATWPVLGLGLIAAMVVVVRRRTDALPLFVPAVVLFGQFVCIGAGKPDEYGRFGVFYECALAIGAACLLSWLMCRNRGAGAAATAVVCVICAWSTGGYLYSLQADAAGAGSRDLAAAYLAEN